MPIPQSLRIFTSALCAVGLYASVFMLRKSVRASRGKLRERSVVQTPRARVAGVPNAAVGLVYYVALGVGVWFVSGTAGRAALEFAAILAAIASLYLAYSLLRVTRMSCAYCWTAHAANWALAVLLAFAWV